MIQFEWDPAKAKMNLRKHGVAFREAATVLRDPLGITIFDPDHSDEEDRFITFGFSAAGRLLMVAHTERGERIRIISARGLTRAEREAYEQEIQRRQN
ncbi:MAG: BrnT family toxin [Deltaproteobacteria bacterium]|nr:BrnT family toxin [Deltaproteobacteria bacterium]MBW1794132.1 BrnT family toxin [Deltaproteobacteria bacterium]MBW2330855.1 BrnT family toxin [Deltaproteobacteria bacterium]